MVSWRDDKARATLIRDAAGSVQPGKTPRTFAELLFGHTNIEDLAGYDALSLAFLAEQAWELVQMRTAGSADIRVINPMMPDGREISVLEILNDNMPFLVDSTRAELAEQGIEVTLVAHPIIAVERDVQGNLLHFHGEALPEGAQGARESLIHLHITRLDAETDRNKLIDGLTGTAGNPDTTITNVRNDLGQILPKISPVLDVAKIDLEELQRIIKGLDDVEKNANTLFDNAGKFLVTTDK